MRRLIDISVSLRTRGSSERSASRRNNRDVFGYGEKRLGRVRLWEIEHVPVPIPRPGSDPPSRFRSPFQWRRQPTSSLAVDVSTVPHAVHAHDPYGVGDLVYDAVIAHANPPVV